MKMFKMFKKNMFKSGDIDFRFIANFVLKYYLAAVTATSEH